MASSNSKKQEELEIPNQDSDPQTEPQSFAEGLFGNDVYEAAPRQKKDFLPWHKPRKQFVRHKQWCEHVKKLIAENIPDGNVVKYLGLPGDDLLDLRYFHKEVCEPNKIVLKYLGFNTSAGSDSLQNAELNISRDELNKMPYIDPTSNVIPDDISQIANKKSVAWTHSLAMAPFDVVNIDLCDGFAKQPPAKFLVSHYNALSQLLVLQSKQKKPWLLFLTTRTSSGDIEKEVLDRLTSLYGDNLKNCTSFLERSTEHFSITDDNTLESAITTDKGLSDVFLISLCKWISGMLIGQNPPSKLSLRSVIGYRVVDSAPHTDLVSIVLRIEPHFTPAPDKIGLTLPTQSTINECDIATQILIRVFKQVDADSVLSGDEALQEEMIKASITLLEEARYDVSGYREWLG